MEAANSKLYQALKAFQKIDKGELTVTQLCVLLYLYQRKAKETLFQEIITELNVSKSFVSRIVKKFSRYTNSEGEWLGLGLIKEGTSAQNRALKAIWLSEAGLTFVEAALRHLED